MAPDVCLGRFCVTFVKTSILPTLAYPPPGQPRQTFLGMYRAKRMFAYFAYPFLEKNFYQKGFGEPLPLGIPPLGGGVFCQNG